MPRETQLLPCALTDRELAARADQLASTVAQLVDLEIEKKRSASLFKERLDMLSSAAKTLAKEIRARAEDRDVEVEEVHDDIRFCVDTIRCDTGEVVESRAMSKEEKEEAMQTSLPGLATKRRGRGRLAPVPTGGKDGGPGAA